MKGLVDILTPKCELVQLVREISENLGLCQENHGYLSFIKSRKIHRTFLNCVEQP